MTVSTAIIIVYTLQRLHNFTHRLVISSLTKRLEVSILPNVHFLWCTTRRSPRRACHEMQPIKLFKKIPAAKLVTCIIFAGFKILLKLGCYTRPSSWVTSSPPSRQPWSRGERFQPSGYIATSAYWAHNTSMRLIRLILARGGQLISP
jgi:hypothetical protein